MARVVLPAFALEQGLGPGQARAPGPGPEPGPERGPGPGLALALALGAVAQRAVYSAGRWRRSPQLRPRSQTACRAPGSAPAPTQPPHSRYLAQKVLCRGSPLWSYLILQAVERILHFRQRALGVYHGVQKYLWQGPRLFGFSARKQGRTQLNCMRTDSGFAESLPMSWNCPGCVWTSCSTHHPTPARTHAPPANVCSAHLPW